MLITRHSLQALCDASSGLTNFAHEDRQWALMRGLEDISAEIQAATRSGVAIWSPMGTGDDRIVRIAARECKLLNSRRAAGGSGRSDLFSELTGKSMLTVPTMLLHHQQAPDISWGREVVLKGT